MSEFAVETMTKLIRKASGIRVSPGAAIELGEVIDNYGTKVCEEAMKLANKRGFKTMDDKDIRKATTVV